MWGHHRKALCDEPQEKMTCPCIFTKKRALEEAEDFVVQGVRRESSQVTRTQRDHRIMFQLGREHYLALRKLAIPRYHH